MAYGNIQYFRRYIWSVPISMLLLLFICKLFNQYLIDFYLIYRNLIFSTYMIFASIKLYISIPLVKQNYLVKMKI